MSDIQAKVAHELVLLHQQLAASESTEVVLQRLVRLAVSMIEGCDWAAVTGWPENRRPRCLAWTHNAARDVDRLQYEAGEGPCLTAADQESEPDGELDIEQGRQVLEQETPDQVTPHEPVQMTDISTETRWPEFVANVRGASAMQSMVAFHVRDLPHRAALNLYSTRPHGFTAQDVTDAVWFAASASVLLMHAESSTRASTLTAALESSRQIGIALGILMSTHRVTDEQAFQMLARSSQNLNRKLRDVAADIALTGALPGAETGLSPAGSAAGGLPRDGLVLTVRGRAAIEELLDEHEIPGRILGPDLEDGTVRLQAPRGG